MAEIFEFTQFFFSHHVQPHLVALATAFKWMFILVCIGVSACFIDDAPWHTSGVRRFWIRAVSWPVLCISLFIVWSAIVTNLEEQRHAQYLELCTPTLDSKAAACDRFFFAGYVLCTGGTYQFVAELWYTER